VPELDLIATTAFGLEAVAAREIESLGYEPKTLSTGRIHFRTDEFGLARANLRLRTADRVLLRVGHFPAPDFDALFETTKSLPWENWLPRDAVFPVNGRSVKSQLTSVPAVQRAVKKAIVDRLMTAHKTRALPEIGARYIIEIALLDNQATITLDTSGDGLHKRGYRDLMGEAALKETLAAGLVLLSVWRPHRALIDPFCGTGTIAIEAAMIGRDIAPGLYRRFDAEAWTFIPSKVWKDAREEARAAARPSLPITIHASDASEEALSLARRHADRAGVARDIHFQKREFLSLESKAEYGCIVANPPYGKRMGVDDSIERLYRSFPEVLRRFPTWSHHILTARLDLEQLVGQPATRRRKLFNAQIECTYYTFLGPRPPRESEPSRASGRTNEPLAPVESVPSFNERTEDAEGEATTHPNHAPQESDATRATDRRLGPVGSDDATVTRGAPVSPPGARTTVARGAASASEQAPGEHSFEVSRREGANEPDEAAELDSPRSQTPHQTTTSIANSPSHRLTVSPPSPPSPPSPTHPLTSSPSTPAFGGLRPRDTRELDDFEARLTKLARHLRKWPDRGITCYRLYERDCPDVPVVIDRYENYAHIFEHEREHSRTLAQHLEWLDEITKRTARVLNIPLESVHIKNRPKQRGLTQHEKLAASATTITVTEGGLKFEINLTNYADTGLFLDHRNTRAMVRDLSKGVRFLNLFCYTGAFTVYAAAGGAASSVSVDLSNTYLEWAERNMRLNGLASPKHRFVRSDTLEFLRTHPPGAHYDLAIVDPPTFSNSKSTVVDWEVQTGHAEMLSLLLPLMAAGSTIFFSTNFRRFKLDEESLLAAREGLTIQEISRRTVPEDFRNERIHRCWKLTIRAS